MDSTPEAQARRNIDDQLDECGWTVQDYERADITAALGVAIREFQLQGRDAADYLLYADSKAIGVVEAKPEGHTLTGVNRDHSVIRLTKKPAGSQARLTRLREMIYLQPELP